MRAGRRRSPGVAEVRAECVQDAALALRLAKKDKSNALAELKARHATPTQLRDRVKAAVNKVARTMDVHSGIFAVLMLVQDL